MVWHWLVHVLGVDDVSGRAYAWWSGAGSDIGEFAILGAVAGAWHRMNCHAKGCPRIGRVPLDGTPWRLCWRHHPGDKPDRHHILRAHHEHLARQATGGTPP